MDPRVAVLETQHRPRSADLLVRRAHRHTPAEQGDRLRGAVLVSAVRAGARSTARHRGYRITRLLSAPPGHRRTHRVLARSQTPQWLWAVGPSHARTRRPRRRGRTIRR